MEHDLPGLIVLIHGFDPIYQACVEDAELGPLVIRVMDILLTRAKEKNKPPTQ